MSFLFGDPARNEQVSTLTPQQQQLLSGLLQALQGQGAGGAFGNVADYYRDLLSNDSNTFNQMIAPEMRRFNEEIIPGLGEQFAGMGAGNLSSSGFRNAAVNAGTDLSERLGAIRAQLRQQGAAGLAGLGQQGLGQYTQNVHHPATGGLFDSIGPAIGAGLSAFGGPALGVLGNAAGNWLTSSMKGKSSPYGGGMAGANQGARF